MELSSITPNVAALQKAMEMARALNSEIEGLYITDDEIEQVCGLVVARTVNASGRNVAHQAAQSLKRDVYLATRSMQRQFDELANRARLKHQFKSVAGRPSHEVLKACADDDAASLLVMSETVALAQIPHIDQLLTQPSSLRGILMIGPGADKRSGPTVIVPQEADTLPDMLDLAEALTLKDKPLIIFLSGADDRILQEEANQLHGSLKPNERINILTALIPQGQPQAMTAAIMRLGCGLVITEYGGSLVPGKSDILPLASSLPCPLLITR